MPQPLPKEKVFGGPLYARRALIKELEQHPLIQEALISQPPKPSRWPWFSPVRSALREIVAQPRPWAIRLGSFLLGFVWNRIFKGIDICGLEQVRQLPAGKTIVYVPCHRSHLDYCLLSYLLYHDGLAVPHIIAGNNLNLFAVGSFLKRCGAVFIRRVFKGDTLYSNTFLSYLYYLLDRRFPLEFFIEGGRSRTGKNLPPKIGILSMLVQYLQDRPNEDLWIVPISVVYEKLMEESSYVKELGGLPKREESLGDLLRAYKLLSVNFGKVFVSFAEPFSLRESVQQYRQEHLPTGNMPALGTPDLQEMLYSLGMEIMDRINRYIRTSAVPIIATAMLSEERQGFRKQELLEKGELLLKVYRAMHPRADETVIEANTAGLERVIGFMLQRGSVGCLPDKNGDIYYFRIQNKIPMNIYKNTLVHHFVLPSLMAYQLEQRPQTHQSLLNHILFFDHLFRYEFMFPRSYDFREGIEAALKIGQELGLIFKQEEVFEANHERIQELQMLARILHPFREIVHVAIYALQGGAPDFPISSKALVKHMQHTFLKLHLLGRIEAPEANLTVSYQNIVRFLSEEGYLHTYKEESKSLLGPGPKFAQLNALEDRLKNA